MKRNFLLVIILLSGIQVFAQNTDNKAKGFQFTTVKENPITSIKNQASSGTCWCFSGLAFIESELLRSGKGTYDFSEMYLVSKNYQEKAKKYVRMHGETNFGGGGSFADVIDGIRDYGLVPESAMPGLNYGEEKHNHGELDKLTEVYVKAEITNPSRKLTTAWFEGFKGIVDAYLGKCPETFTYEGKEYTPKSFASSVGVVADNYVSLTSFSHHPFYQTFPIEVPDNWRWALSYNIPIDELITVIQQAVEKGYCVAWASDVSEKGFSRKGVAIVPDLTAPEVAGTDQARWLGLTQKERDDILANLNGPTAEIQVTQEVRQKAFDNYETTDDHGMLIYGLAKDQNGTPYFMVKNSWGENNTYKGTWYASQTFVKYKTLNVVINKEALPKDLRQKLNIK